MPVAVSAPPAAPTDPTTRTPLAEPAGTAGTAASPDAVRWGLFCCLLVPAAFAVYGTRFGSAASCALGLAAVTAACRLLLRRSAYDTTGAATPAHLPSPAREAEGAHRGGR
ncbi:hypothetical protein ACFT7S_10745 [Streptomyces sp. NPDC057136]|uniref:hypothetical protein n=1 Tax=Streptomyces sp. NPDC057136 TaxID=3346029 RepID=UPI00362A277A